MSTPDWLDSECALARFLEELPPGEPVALDTEFQWTSTYYPVLALVQIGTPSRRIGVIDALALEGWRPLAAILADPGRQKILFSGGNDLPLMVRRCGGGDQCLPQNLFDVQLANSFCGGELSASLKAVAAAQLGILLDKQETLSDWTRRPLTASQMEYAAGDVELLPELAQRFAAMLADNGNLEAFQEEMALWSRPEAYAEPAIEAAWHRVRGTPANATPMARARLRALAAWREGLARQRDLPRNWILSDEQLLWLATRDTDSDPAAALASLPPASHGAGRRHREAIAELLRRTVPTPEDAPANREKTAARIRRERIAALKNRLAGLVSSRAASRGIPAELLAPKRELEAVAAAYLSHAECRDRRIFQGWRGRLLQPTLDEILP